MDWISFKSFVKKLNIKYFDGELRVAHHRINHLLREQQGSGFINKQSSNVINPNLLVNKLTDNQNRILIDSLVLGNVEKINYIINNYI